MTASNTVTPLAHQVQRSSRQAALTPPGQMRIRNSVATVSQLPFGQHLRTSTSAYAPEQMPLPIPGPRTLLPAPVERGTVATGELRHRSARFMQAIAEVIAGVRPSRQLTPWLTREVHEELNKYVQQTLQSMAGASRQRAQVVSVHVFMVNENAAEIAARMVLKGRSHAIAARLQHVTDPRERSIWRCTALAWA